MTQLFKKTLALTAVVAVVAMGAQAKPKMKVYETSAAGNKMKLVKATATPSANLNVIEVKTQKKRQTIEGFGGAFTEASASLLSQMSPAKRQEILDAYFGKDGARYSLTRTHIASCDFSKGHYGYTPVENDATLEHFTIEEDMKDLIPMIKGAQKASQDGFRILASPWTAPIWMKDNKTWISGHILPEWYETFALYFSKYIEAYKNLGIDIWGVTVMNEPLGNGGNWESTDMSPAEMTNIVAKYLGPHLEKAGLGDVKIFGYDQNRGGLKDWTTEMYRNDYNARYYAGCAIHWYESTYDYCAPALEEAHALAPDKLLLETEGCIDADVPHWQDDAWYWSPEATDWGWDWAPDEQKYLHPKYEPTYRYVRDIIGCLNHWVAGWIDWNMVLDKQGGPNWFHNWCCAPVIVDPQTDEVYYTPLFYAMEHFSRFLRPGAKVVETTITTPHGFIDNMVANVNDMMAVAVINPDNTRAMVVFNPTHQAQTYQIKVDGKSQTLQISPAAIQTIVNF